MITRIYANNFRCLVAFDATFDSFGVLCGPNGVGKSSVFDALRIVRDLGTATAVLGGDAVNDIRELEFTNWLDGKTERIQEFEIGVTADDHQFDYKLHIEQASGDVKPRIVKESATCDGRELFQRDLDGVTFMRADGSEARFPLDWRQAALGAIQPNASLKGIETLQETLASIQILRPSPRQMEVESKAEARQPTLDMANILSWYRSLAQEQEWTDALRDSLKNVWPDFKSFKLQNVGLNTKALQFRFDSDLGRSAEPFYFHQLSDGEKMLFALYMIRTAMETSAAKIVLIDEPDNYVGLPELLPWVLAMRELLDDEHQTLLISHHPEILGNAGEADGRYLWRDNHSSPTRIGPLKVPEGISPAEAITRGWASGK